MKYQVRYNDGTCDTPMGECRDTYEQAHEDLIAAKAEMMKTWATPCPQYLDIVIIIGR